MADPGCENVIVTPTDPVTASGGSPGWLPGDAPAADFAIPADLWARTVYDFLLAYHLRTINRGHLLGAFTPLYLAWVASHLRRSEGDATLAAFHAEETAAAFVAEKPYIVSRWRWPDRFNP